MKPSAYTLIPSISRGSFFSRMKIAFVIVCLLATPITGCFSYEVVYRINPDSPPAMSVQEARDAIAFALSQRVRWRGIDRVYLDGDDLVVWVSVSKLSVPWGVPWNVPSDEPGKIMAGYDQIGQEIIKEGNLYKIPVKLGSIVFGLRPGQGDYIMSHYVFLWKSEEDARLFLDAIYILLQNKYGEKKQR